MVAKHTRTLLFFLFSLATSTSVSATMSERRDTVFKIETDLLEQGEVHYFFRQLPADMIQKKLTDFVELDAARLLEKEGATIQVSKLAYVVNKPAGFFSAEQTADAAWLTKLLGVSAKQLKEGVYQVEELGQLKVLFDSDDLSTVRNSRFVHAVTQSRKLDPIALSGFSTVVFHTENSVQLDNHVSLSPKKTLVITYQLRVVKNETDAKAAKEQFIKQIEAKLVRAYP